MSIQALLAEHNALAAKAGGTILKNWKQSTDKLQERLNKLRAAAAVLEEAKKAPPREKKKDASPRLTVKRYSLEKLCEVAYYEDKTKSPNPENRVDKDHPNARSVGFSYDEVIASVREKFPDGQTTLACLRWYAVKVRVEEFGYEGFQLPQRRPRSVRL